MLPGVQAIFFTFEDRLYFRLSDTVDWKQGPNGKGWELVKEV